MKNVLMVLFVHFLELFIESPKYCLVLLVLPKYVYAILLRTYMFHHSICKKFVHIHPS